MGNQKSTNNRSNNTAVATSHNHNNIPASVLEHKFEFTYIIVKSNAELTIGNREIIHIRFSPINNNNNKNRKNQSVQHTIENGRFKTMTQYPIYGSQEQPSFYDSFVESILNKYSFLEMKNKNKKTLNTSGSDAGSTLLLSCSFNGNDNSSNGGSRNRSQSKSAASQQAATTTTITPLRREIKNSDQKTLDNTKQLDNFVQIEKSIQEWNRQQVESRNYRLVQFELHRSLIKHFALNQGENATPFSVSFLVVDKQEQQETSHDASASSDAQKVELTDQLTKFMCYMTDSSDSTDEQSSTSEKQAVWLPVEIDLYLIVKKYDVMMDDDDEEEGDEANNSREEESLNEMKLKVLLNREQNNQGVKCITLALGEEQELLLSCSSD